MVGISPAIALDIWSIWRLEKLPASEKKQNIKRSDPEVSSKIMVSRVAMKRLLRTQIQAVYTLYCYLI